MASLWSFSFSSELHGMIVRLFISPTLHTPKSPLKRGLDVEIPLLRGVSRRDGVCQRREDVTGAKLTNGLWRLLHSKHKRESDRT